MPPLNPSETIECFESTIVSGEFTGGTRGSPIMPRDVSLSDSKCWNGGQKWDNTPESICSAVVSVHLCIIICVHLCIIIHAVSSCSVVVCINSSLYSMFNLLDQLNDLQLN